MKRTVQSMVACLGGLASVLALLLLINRATPVRADPGVLYVAPGSKCNGASPCYGSVQAAVDAAVAGDEIRVAAGTYTGVSTREELTQTVYISKTITVQGGYAATDWATPDPDVNPTTLDAQQQGRVLYITGDISPTLGGLRIKGGATDSDGGGIRIGEAQATISNCHILSNTADWGAGLALWNSPSQLSGNVIRDNVADGAGGGLGLSHSDATLTANDITSNTATSSGGGLYMSHSDATLADNTIAGNSASGGGGIFFWHSDAVLDANIVIANSANAGALFMHASWSVLINNAILENHGGGICLEGASPRLIHNTIATNGTGLRVDDRWQGGIHYVSSPILTNTILADHNVGIEVTGGNTLTVDSVLWHDTTITVSESTAAAVTVQNEHTGDPVFAVDGYHITPTSAAMDIGVDTGVTSDIDGHHRPYNSTPDVGADEIIATSVATDTEGTLAFTDTQGLITAVQVPSSAVTDTTTLAYTPVETTTSPAGFAFVGHAFDLDAYRGGALLPSFAFSKPVTITIHYDESDLYNLDEDTLVLNYWDEDACEWIDAASTCTPASIYERHLGENWLAVPVCHLSRFAMFGGHKVYLPLVVRNH